MNKYIYSAAAFLSLSCIALTSCQNEMEQLGTQTGKEVLLRVTANRGDAETRTTLSPDGAGNLECKWQSGDKLLVVNNTNGNKLGVITLVSGEDTAEGTFEGNVPLDNLDVVSLVYLGTAGNAETYTANNMELNLSAQDGSLTSLSTKDVLTAETSVVNSAYVSKKDDVIETKVTMTRQLAFGYFTLNLPDNITLAANDVISITGTGLKSEGKVNFKSGGSIPTTTNYTGSTTITITKAEAGNSFYVAMLPCGNVTPTFTVVKDGYSYTANLTAHNWVKGEFVRKDVNGNPVEVANWTKTKLPVNYGDMGNWIKENKDADYLVFNPIFMSNGCEDDQNKNAWEPNLRQYGVFDEYGGWVTTVEYKNGLMLNMLTSQGGRDFYFQWGRQMGHPSDVGSSVNAYYPLGSDEASNLSNGWIGYEGHTGMTVYYEYVYMGSTSWPMGRVNNSSLAFGKVSRLSNGSPFDYSLPNSKCNWEERSGGNICPDGYRIPSAEELAFFVPSTGKVSGTYAEIKTVNGKKYALQWTAQASTSTLPATIVVKCVETSKTSVTKNDAIFNNASQLNLRTYGYLNNEAEFKDRGTIGIYWSNETGNAADWKTEASGNGGQALFIKFTASTTAEISMKGIPRSYGACVLPIKDENAKGISYRPYFPWAGKVPDDYKLNK